MKVLAKEMALLSVARPSPRLEESGVKSSDMGHIERWLESKIRDAAEDSGLSGAREPRVVLSSRSSGGKTSLVMRVHVDSRGVDSFCFRTLLDHLEASNKGWDIIDADDDSALYELVLVIGP